MSTTEAHLYEVFSSIQGEGLYVGDRQIFIRFLMCNLSCTYCDSADCLVPHKTFRVEETPGKRDFKIENNPATVDQLAGLLDHFNRTKGLNSHVSLTGGEPLLQVDFIRSFAPKIKERGLKVYLETNGTMPERLSEVIGLIDTVAMDIKLPSIAGSDDMLARHKKFLEIAFNTDVFVKIVFGKSSTPVEIENASRMIAEIDPEIPLVLQPVTPTRDIKHGPGPEQSLLFHSIAKRNLKIVKVIPQVHKLFGQL